MEEIRLTHEQFVMLAIAKLKHPKYKGLHSVYSGFNDAFRDYYPGEDPVAAVKALVKAGKFVTRPSKRGVLIFLPGDAEDVSPDAVLGKMGLK